MRPRQLVVACMMLLTTEAWAVDFAHEVAPLLERHCGACHAGDARQGGLSLNTREQLLAGGDSGIAAIVIGRADESELIRRITSQDATERMPAETEALPTEAVALLREWIDGGAAWEEGFAFVGSLWEPPLRLRNVSLPAAEDGRDNPVDRVIDAAWRAESFARPPRSDDRTFIRRVSLDLVGLLPEPDRVEAFVADGDPHKRTRLVADLLDDDLSYAEHWLSFWNDLLRNDYSGTGFITGGRRQITSWLHRSLVENMPYDRFVRELISPSEESRGFIDGIVWRGTVNASQAVPIQFAQNVGQTFLGINLKCASCHDSFVDRWTLEQTYGLAAIMAEQPLELHRCDKATGRIARAAWIFPELGEVDPSVSPTERLSRLAAIIAQPDNGWLSRTLVNRLWHRLLGRGIVHPVDSLRTRPWNEDLLEVLAGDLVRSGWNVRHVLSTIATSEAYGAATPSVSDTSSAMTHVFQGPLPRRMTAEQFSDCLWQLTGSSPEKSDAEVVRTTAEHSVAPMVRAALVKATPLMTALGRPNRDQVVTSRPSDLTTLEAIQLANEQGLADELSAGAERILTVHGPTPEPILGWLFAAALSRPPSDAEAEACRSILGTKPTSQSVADCLWAVVMLPEFQLIR